MSFLPSRVGSAGCEHQAGAGIAASRLPIHDPARLDLQNHSVSIDGIVTTSWGVPLAPFKMYKVDDGTGEVTVLSQSHRIPTRGAHVRVKGRVDEIAVLGGQSVGLHLKEERLSVRRR